MLEIVNLEYSAGSNPLSITAFEKGVFFVSGDSFIKRRSLLLSLAGLKKISKGDILYKKVSAIKCNKSYRKNAIQFIDTNFSIFSPDLTVWQNLEILSKIRKNPEIAYIIIRYFSFEDILDTKVKLIEKHELVLLELSRALFFDRAGIWFLILNDFAYEKNSDEHKLITHIIKTKSENDGIVFYTTNSSSKESLIEIENQSEINTDF